MAKRVPLRRNAFGIRPRATLVSALFVLAALMVTVPLAGAGILDQSQPVVTNTVVNTWDSDYSAQTFTSGITGGLDRVDLPVAHGVVGANPLVPFIVEIWPLSGGTPRKGPALASASILKTSLPLRGATPPGFSTIRFVPPAPVTAGVRYAIVLPELANCGAGDHECFGWYAGPAGDPYPAGAGFTSRDAGVTWTPLSTGSSTDFAFKTYVTPPRFAKEQCKKGGWRRFADPSFKNQGQCVKFVKHHGAKSSEGKDDDKSPGKKKTGKKK